METFRQPGQHLEDFDGPFVARAADFADALPGTWVRDVVLVLVTDIEDRINECMTRSMNGEPLPMDSPEMIAMASYLRSLGADYAAMGAASKKPDEPLAFKAPDRRADLLAGQTVYTERCSICHGADGGGLLATEDARRGYLFPALWGPNSYNDGAGMARVLTASRFIKARMPLGQPDLTDDEAFDVAAYVNSQPRPEMPNLANDYPDRALKPIDNGYGPYADSFPQDQHKSGPFKPIEDYYKSLKKPGSYGPDGYNLDMLSVLRRVAIVTSVGVALATFGVHAQTPVAAPGAGSVVVLETAKGIIEFETYPDTAPKAVAHILALVQKTLLCWTPFPPCCAELRDPDRRSDNARFHEAGELGQLFEWNSGGRIGTFEDAKARGRHGLPGAPGRCQHRR